MTHTLHRHLTEKHDVSNDFVVLCMPSKDINHVNSAPKLKRYFELCLEHGAVNVGDARKGNKWWQGSYDAVRENIEDRAVINACFDDEEKLISLLKALIKEDLGLSVVVSGLFEKVAECCHKAGLKPHTENRSLKIWGQTELLPPEEILAIQTMCGHGMVTTNLVNHMIKRIRRGSITPEEAAQELAKPCMCGIFNTKRAAKILEALSKE